MLIIQNRRKQRKLLDMLTDVYDGTKINNKKLIFNYLNKMLKS